MYKHVHAFLDLVFFIFSGDKRTESPLYFCLKSQRQKITTTPVIRKHIIHQTSTTLRVGVSIHSNYHSIRHPKEYKGRLQLQYTIAISKKEIDTSTLYTAYDK